MEIVGAIEFGMILSIRVAIGMDKMKKKGLKCLGNTKKRCVDAQWRGARGGI